METVQILNECSFLNDQQIKLIEKTYNAKYVFESCLKNKDGNWINFPAAIFYTEGAHPDGSNYFGIYRNPDTKTFLITDAISSTEPFIGRKIDNRVVYSRYRHDFRECGGIFVDGGRDYHRFGELRSGESEAVKIMIDKDKLVLEQA